MLTTTALQDAAVLVVDIASGLAEAGIPVREITMCGMPRRAQDVNGLPMALVRVEVALRDLEAARDALTASLATARRPVAFDTLIGVGAGYEADLRGMRLMLWACHGQQDVTRAAAGMVGGAA